MEEKITGVAYFLMDARRLEDLREFHQAQSPKRSSGKRYVVEKVIELGKISYENLCEDLLADRDFIRDNAVNLMRAGEDGAWHCLLVIQKGKPDMGILIASRGFPYPKFASYYEKPPEIRLV